MKFTELPLAEQVLAGIEKAGYSECTDVQERVLPLTLSGRDVMVQSKTGSGKTAVFLITILEKYAKNKASASLIVAPTRELAVQIEEDAKLLAAGYPEFRIGCFYGGVGYKEQMEELRSGLNLYVGTPGRLLDFAKSNKIDFRCFDTVVLDEADRMFDMGFYPDIQTMFSRMVSPKSRQTMLFSATLSTRVRNLAWKYMNEADEITVQPEEITVKNIIQELFHVSKDEKFPLLLSILKKINPESCLIFTNTKDMAVEVAKRLQMNGYRAEYLMGDMPQTKRLKTIDRMKNGSLPILVATDVAARGLQIDDLALVVNYDIPEDFENYVHRIGRTARAGKSGKAITLACEEYIYGLEAIENYIQMRIPVLWPDEAGLESVEDKSEGYHYKSSRRPAAQSKSRSNNKNRAPQKAQRKSGNKPTERKERERDYDKLSHMTLEERMAYYKNVYGGSGKAEGQTQKKRPQTQKKPQKKPIQSSRTVQSQPVKKEAAPQQEVKVVKKGIFSRIVDKLRGR